MPIVRYGEWGRALLLFPTAQADFLDNERFGLIDAIAPLIEDGRVNVFCINTINNESWMDRGLHPAEKARRQQLYAGYIEHEVVAHIRKALGNDEARIGVSGASFGAYHAANSFFRRPDQFDTLIAMSGFYELWPSWLHGFSNDDVYYNNPMWYAPRITDGHQRNLIAHSQVHILSGQGAFEIPDESKRFSTALGAAGLPHHLDLWGHDVPHDWPSWRSMLSHYLGHRVGW
jgi:esterase/lipase superfamily enzyme